MDTLETSGSPLQTSTYFLVYSTANDDPNYIADFLNFTNMVRFHPRVDSIDVHISISLVTPLSNLDRFAMTSLIRLTADCPWINIRSVTWKSNVGRDFSSVAASLRRISGIARSHDFVMIRNRSAYGPFSDGWYRAYLSQYTKHPGVGLVGSTINFSGHPQRPTAEIATHVQTYVYATEWRHLESLLSDYPGERCKDRLDLINEGELGLSRRILGQGLGLSCLKWPDQVFTLTRPSDPDLPQGDDKATADSLPLRYRFAEHLRDRTTLFQRLLWKARLKTARVRTGGRDLSKVVDETFLGEPPQSLEIQ